MIFQQPKKQVEIDTTENNYARPWTDFYTYSRSLDVKIINKNKTNIC